MSAPVYRLWRYTHANGRAKEWALAVLPDGTLAVRRGPAGRLSAVASYPAAQADALAARVRRKLARGYTEVGRVWIAGNGRPTPLPAPAPVRPGGERLRLEPGALDPDAQDFRV